MIRGLYRSDADWVMVLFENGELPVSSDQYRSAEYDPPLDSLPWREEYDLDMATTARQTPS